MLEYRRDLKPLARKLRSNMTDAEQTLWHHLRRNQLGVRFYRQRPIGPYIVDFYCPAAKLVVELDGGQHFEPQGRSNDARRDSFLEQQGLTVLRYNNHQALTQTADVLEDIARYAQAAEGPPTNRPHPARAHVQGAHPA